MRTARLIIAGASSSAGKTSIACGILAALRERGLRGCAYKIGPDYIDTEYLRRAGGCEAYNLDTWLTGEEKTLELFKRTSEGKDFAIIEGAMGLYDGGENSTATIAKLLNAPVVLVINAKSMGESAAAVALGFREFDRDVNIIGVIFNCVGSEAHEKILREALESSGIKFFGALRRDERLAIPERHLGLLPVLENNFEFGELARAIEESILLDELVRIPPSAPPRGNPARPPLLSSPETFPGKRIAVAHDAAFSFYYPESLDTLRELGAELSFFSPLTDERLPEADGYIFGGGFPEVFAAQLAGNVSMLEGVRQLPKDKKILAECGGLMYLARSITDLRGETFTMAGLVPLDTLMTSRPVIGYMEARALKDNIMCEEGASIRAHEFHYSRAEPELPSHSCAFEITRRRTGTTHLGGFAGENILASYLHVNFFGNVELARRFLTASLQ